MSTRIVFPVALLASAAWADPGCSVPSASLSCLHFFAVSSLIVSVPCSLVALVVWAGLLIRARAQRPSAPFFVPRALGGFVASLATPFVVCLATWELLGRLGLRSDAGGVVALALLVGTTFASGLATAVAAARGVVGPVC